MQRHHLLPVQTASAGCFARMIDAIGRRTIGFDDFRRNGLLLPAAEDRAMLLGLPLHRGPHRDYNHMVIDRVGVIESHWSRATLRNTGAALEVAQFRLNLLQNALRRRLLTPRGSPVRLNNRDPHAARETFAELDAMADLLWADAASSDAGLEPLLAS